MTVTIERESFTPALFTETLPLAQECWNESTLFKAETCAYHGDRDFSIEPDVEAYQRLSDQGVLVLVTLRDGGLRGYLIGFTYTSLHHKNILCGIGDSMYLDPEYRSYTGVMAERFEKEMKALGVEIIGWPAHVDGPVHAVLKARGYVGDDVVMEKRLCV